MSKIYQHSGTHLFLLFWKASHSVMRYDSMSMDHAGFASLSDFAVLEALRQKGAQSIKSLGEKVMLTSGSITTAVQRLEKKGFVCRERDDKDGRLVLIDLTENGRKIIERGFALHEADLERLFGIFSEEERAEFDRLMTRLGQHAGVLMEGNKGK